MSKYTLEELWDLLSLKEKELEEQNTAPINYYIPGDSMTYLSAMSQHWGIEGNGPSGNRSFNSIQSRRNDHDK